MATGFLTPDARLRIVGDLSVVLPGAKLHTYVSGTPSTPLATYSDVALTVPNANPIVASAGGLFGPIYLTPGVSYKLVLTDAADVVVWTQDPVAWPATLSLAAGTGIGLATVTGVTTITNTAPAGVGSIGSNQFRLTLESGVPVSSTDQTAKTVLFCTPGGRGNRIDLHDAGGVPTTVISAQFSIAVPATTSQLYSVFVYNNAGVATLELAAWTNDTTPGTAAFSISAVTGTVTKTGDLTRRYLGLMRTTTVSGQTEDSLAKRYVWNFDNRVPRLGRVIEATATWAYSTNTYRQARATPTNQLDFLIGMPDVRLSVNVLAAASTVTAGLKPVVSIGEDSTTTPVTGVTQSSMEGGGNGDQIALASYQGSPVIGRHTYVWLEKASGATMNWRGTGNDVVSAIYGEIQG